MGRCYQGGLRAFGQVKRGEAKATQFRVRVLERELRKKDKAMADAAALFFLVGTGALIRAKALISHQA
ncbi:hypothetical protein LMG24235_08589 [Paraburkholderia sabiae]|nr:hypothetical protein LMG24235_08589 [Paraburkholderia sabiae]